MAAANYSSSSSTSDQLSTTKTTVTSPIDAEHQNVKKHYQTMVLNQHYMFILEEDFSRLVQCGLMDQLVRVLEDIDNEKQAALLANLNKVKEEQDDDNDNGPVKKKTKKASITTTNESIQTDYGSTPYIFYDPNASPPQELEPGFTYITKSFYGTD